MASGSSSGSSSRSSSSSSSSSERRRHRKEKKRRKREKERKERKKEKKRHEKHGKKRREKHKTERSNRDIISGKKIKRTDGATADAAGEARREALRAAMNEGEDEEYGAAANSSTSATTQKLQAASRQALSDPAAMMELMRASAEKERAKRQRLSDLRSGGVGGDDYASSIGREYSAQRSNATGRRTAYDAADYMKPDSGF